MTILGVESARRALAVGLLVSALAACGSTVQVQDELAVGAGQLVSEDLSPGAGAPPAGAAAGAGPAGAAPVGGATTTTSGDAGTQTTAGRARAAAASGTGGSQAAAPAQGAAPQGTTTRRAPGPGPAARDTSPLKVGVFYLSGGNQVLSAAFPGSSVSFGDGRREAQAVIDDVNARGLAGGRTLVPHFIEVNATDNDAARQQACLGGVQDARPVALFSVFNLSAGLSRCVQQSGVLLINVALGTGDEELYRQAKGLAVSPSQLTRDAEQQLLLAVARSDGRLPAGKPVGLVWQTDDPMYGRVMTRTVQPTLQRLGVPFVVGTVASATDSSGMNAAVLKFASSGVDTVLFSLGSGGIPVVLFMQSAEQQQYRPAYLVGDSSNTAFVGSQAPAQQVRRIVGAGTYPLANVPADQQAPSATETSCLALLNAKIGGYSNRGSSLTGTLYCEIVRSFAHVAARVPGRVTGRSWAEAFQAAGSSYAPTTSFRTAWRPGRPDGASGYRSLAYGAACRCVTYTSPVRPVP